MGNLSSGSVNQCDEVEDIGKEAALIGDEPDEENEELKVRKKPPPRSITKEMIRKSADSVSVDTILLITEFIEILIDRQNYVYKPGKWYGYFKKDKSRSLHLIFPSFCIKGDFVLVHTLPLRRAKHIFFMDPFLVASKYLSECIELRSIVNVKTNARTYPGLSSSAKTLKCLDVRVYSLSNEIVTNLNKLKSLEYLKLNLRKKITNRKDVQVCPVHENLQVLEIWNTSTFQYVLLPKVFYNAFLKLNNLRTLCLVRVKLSEKNLGKILACPSLRELEYLGKLQNAHFVLLAKTDHLHAINLAGSELEDMYITLFTLRNIRSLNFSGCVCDDEKLNFADFRQCINLRSLNLNGLQIPLAVIEQLCWVSSIRELHFERTVLTPRHMELIRVNARWMREVHIHLDLDGVRDVEFLEEVEKIRRNRNIRVLQGKSLMVTNK